MSKKEGNVKTVRVVPIGGKIVSIRNGNIRLDFKDDPPYEIPEDVFNHPGVKKHFKKAPKTESLNKGGKNGNE